MHRRAEMSRAARWLAVLVSSLLSFLADGIDAAPPNVVVFLADDAGWGDFSQNGNRQVATPRIDSLARQGATLEQFFVCTVCAPTRAEFLTGRYHPRGGVRGVSLGYERLNLDERTVADAFERAGYATGAFGKWHNGSQWPYHPQARGFDEYFGHSSGHWGEYFDPPLEHNGRMLRTRGYIVDVCTDRALEFIDRNWNRPFFCYVPFTTPHHPFGVPESDWQRLRNRPIEQRGSQPQDESIDETRAALAMMENQDWNVGRVLDRLEHYGLSERTIVIYFSDNGPNTWRFNGGFKGRKGSIDEGGVRSTCFVRWPERIAAGRKVVPVTGAIDWLPTLTSLAGIERVGDKPLDGRDLSPLLCGTSVEWPERMIFSTWNGRVSVRTDRHRLDDAGKLFDLHADPGQTTPLDEPTLAARLQSAAQAWRHEVLPPVPPATIPPRPGVARPATPSVDPRSFPVGYREFPITMLPARDGEPHGNVRRSSAAPNCSYFVNWTALDDRITWQVDVHTAGRYEVVIDYTCPLPDAGSLIELSLGESRLRGRVTPGWDPPLLTNQDTLPRPEVESTMKDFRPLRLGEIVLPAGVGPLTLRAVEIPGGSVLDLRRLTLTLLPEPAQQRTAAQGGSR